MNYFVFLMICCVFPIISSAVQSRHFAYCAQCSAYFAQTNKSLVFEFLSGMGVFDHSSHSHSHSVSVTLTVTLTLTVTHKSHSHSALAVAVSTSKVAVHCAVRHSTKFFIKYYFIYHLNSKDLALNSPTDRNPMTAICLALVSAGILI